MNCPHQLASRLRDLREIPIAQSSRIHQISTHSESKRPDRYVVGSVCNVYSARWNQGSVREGTFQGLQILGTANVAARKNLDQLCPIVLSMHEFCGCQRTGDCQLGARLRHSEHLDRESRTHQKLGAGTNALVGLFARGNRACPDERFAPVFSHNMGDH